MTPLFFSPKPTVSALLVASVVSKTEPPIVALSFVPPCPSTSVVLSPPLTPPALATPVVSVSKLVVFAILLVIRPLDVPIITRPAPSAVPVAFASLVPRSFGIQTKIATMLTSVISKLLRRFTCTLAATLPRRPGAGINASHTALPAQSPRALPVNAQFRLRCECHRQRRAILPAALRCFLILSREPDGRCTVRECHQSSLYSVRVKTASACRQAIVTRTTCDSRTAPANTRINSIIGALNGGWIVAAIKSNGLAPRACQIHKGSTSQLRKALAYTLWSICSGLRHPPSIRDGIAVARQRGVTFWRKKSLRT